jgi:hypothetical protein
MSTLEQAAFEDKDISDLCVKEVIADGGFSTPAAWKYLTQAEQITNGLKIDCNKCGQCAMFMAGLEAPVADACIIAPL